MATLDRQICIVGAGIGGLSTALFLHNRGFRNVSVLEQSSQLSEVGAGLQIGANGMRLLKQLGLSDALLNCASLSTSGQIMDGYSGNALCTYPLNDWSQARYGLPYMQLRRADLQRVLVDALAKTNISLSLGQRIESSGLPNADLLIGADGVRSTVRQQLFGQDKPLHSGRVAYRSMIDTAEPGAALVWSVKGAHLVQYPVNGGKQLNLVACVDQKAAFAEDYHGASPTDALGLAFRGACGQLSALIGLMQDAGSWGLYERSRLNSWVRDNAVLVGDAAHAMLPSLAQGAVMAIEDAAVLADCLAIEVDDQSAALLEYQRLRMQRCYRVQDQSRQNMAFFHRQQGELQRLALGLLGKNAAPVIGRKLDWLYGFTALPGSS